MISFVFVCLSMQRDGKLRSLCLESRVSNVASFRPGVGHNIALHVKFADRNFIFVISALVYSAAVFLLLFFLGGEGHFETKVKSVISRKSNL